MNDNSTNSKKGSYHWFHTIIANHKHIGEYLSKESPGEEILREWGKQLFDTSNELIVGYDLINLKVQDTKQIITLKQALEYEIRNAWLPQFIWFEWGRQTLQKFSNLLELLNPEKRGF